MEANKKKSKMGVNWDWYEIGLKYGDRLDKLFDLNKLRNEAANYVIKSIKKENSASHITTTKRKIYLNISLLEDDYDDYLTTCINDFVDYEIKNYHRQNVEKEASAHADQMLIYAKHFSRLAAKLEAAIRKDQPQKLKNIK